MRNKILIGCLSIILLFGIVSTSIAQGDYWKLISGKLYPIVNTWQLGSSVTRIAKGWFTDLDVSGTFTLGGVVGTGGMDLNGQQLILDADGDLVFQAAVNNILTLTGGDLTLVTAGSDLTVPATTTSGMLNVGSGKLYVGENGYVGIGTMTPAYTFDVDGDIVGGDVSVPTSGGFYMDAGVWETSITSYVNDNGRGFGFDTNSQKRMFIDFNGYVGIGTTTPAYPLVVNNDSASAFYVDSSGKIVVSGGIISQASSTITNTLNVVATTTLDNGLIVDGNTIYAMSDNNRIGLSTSTPRYTLDVWGSLAVGTTTSPLIYADAGNSAITIGGDMTTGNIIISPDSGVVTLIDMSVTSGASAGTEESYSFNLDASSTPNLIIWGESDGANNVRNQRVGIATTTPATRLDVKGEMRAISPTTSTCNALIEGATFFNQTDKRGYMCDGTTWHPLW